MAMFTAMTIVFSVINLVLIVSLLYVYGKNAVKIKSLFTMGLIIFAALFLVHNAVSLYFMSTMMPYYGPEAEGYGFLFTILQTIAFSILNFITWR